MNAYDEGFSAATGGEYDDANPYAVGSDESDAWLDGWVNGEAYQAHHDSREEYADRLSYIGRD